MTVFATNKKTGHTTVFENVLTLRTTDFGMFRLNSREFTILIDPETHVIDVDCCD